MLTKLKTLDRTFVTNPEHWLGHSTYFEALFSGRWSGKEEDGSYSIESEGAVFEHILRHLRSGVLPIFYDVAKGHDFSLYYSLLQEAEYFGIIRLSKWLREKTYLDAVQIRYAAARTSESLPSYPQPLRDHDRSALLYESEECISMVAGGHVEVTFSPSTHQRNTDGKNDGGQGNSGGFAVLVVRKELRIDYDRCVNAFRENTSA